MLDEIYSTCRVTTISGRFITADHVAVVLNNFSVGTLAVAGESVQGQPIYSFRIGNGKTKMLLWSQMHGNESTTTKALLDFLSMLQTPNERALQILAEFTILAFPVLNPDGALLYTRENANGIDLNRDFISLSQPESRLLLEAFTDFEPDFCYNLHDQRTLYGAGNDGKPATVSFLAPAYNEETDVNETRLKAINVIAAMNDALQEVIPDQVGRFDDSYNPNCAGDSFQSAGVPTILFEAGHAPHDYERELSRKYIFIALFTSFKVISENVIVNNRLEDYLNIPQNMMVFYDFVYRNVKIYYDGNEIITTFAAQYTEEAINGKVIFTAHIADAGLPEGFFGHTAYDAQGAAFRDFSDGRTPKPGERADFFLGSKEFINGAAVL
ncbi:MAG TPA: M14 metallopeptidase family protein [Flavobacterium sp.]|jgi:hypothetical protein